MIPLLFLLFVGLIIFMLSTKQKINTYSWDWANDDWILNVFGDYCTVTTVTSRVADFYIYDLAGDTLTYMYLMNSNTAEASSITGSLYNFKNDDIRYLGPENFEKDIYDGVLSLQSDNSGWSYFDSFSLVSNTIRATFSKAPGLILFCATSN